MTLNLYILNSCILAGVWIGSCTYYTMIGFVPKLGINDAVYTLHHCIMRH